jgi:hypothetical protein
MFSSKFSKRINQWLRSPKNYQVSFVVHTNIGKHYSPYMWVELEVTAYTKREAKMIAEQKIKEKISMSCESLKCIGKVHKFNNELKYNKI